MSHAELLERIRGEFLEMPGLRLTFPQACRLWQVDPATCQAALDALVREDFLHRTQSGAYLSLPQPRRQLTSTLSEKRVRRASSA